MAMRTNHDTSFGTMGKHKNRESLDEFIRGGLFAIKESPGDINPKALELNHPELSRLIKNSPVSWKTYVESTGLDPNAESKAPLGLVGVRGHER